MDLFKFVTTTSPTTFTEARMINGATSIMWAERYRDAGEFEIIAPLSSGLMTFLPIGAFISHANTYEVMFVENHEIAEDKNEDPIIKITGRSLEAFLEHRAVGLKQVREGFLNLPNYVMTANYAWVQAVSVINDHIRSASQPNDQLDNIIATHNVTGTGVSVARAIQPMNLHAAVLELLAIDDLGVRIIRRNTFAPPGDTAGWTTILIHKGTDKSASVIFSWKSGDLDKTEYLWSNKPKKTTALVMGRFYALVEDIAGFVKYDRRVMTVDASDIDADYETFANEGEANDVIGRMRQRGRLALASQTNVTISRADLANVSKYQYRRDFDVGDLIMLDGNFGQMAVMRVVEYVEIQDENGETGHPTLALPGV